MVSGSLRGSWHVSPVNKGDYCSLSSGLQKYRIRSSNLSHNTCRLSNASRLDKKGHFHTSEALCFRSRFCDGVEHVGSLLRCALFLGTYGSRIGQSRELSCSSGANTASASPRGAPQLEWTSRGVGLRLPGLCTLCLYVGHPWEEHDLGKVALCSRGNSWG